MPLGEAVDYVLQACMAMNEAHALGIIHRDLKPSNLFLTNDNGSQIVKVLDFGISKLASEGDATLTGAESVIGTALYMSPEQVRSSGTVDARSDVWALGVILYELLSGRPPWLGTPTQVAAAIVSEPPPDLRSFGALPDEIVAIVMHALQRNPDHRFPTVKELAYALAPYAPQGSLGRGFVDALASPSNRSSVPAQSRPRLPNLALTPAPVASAQSGARDGGTAPGWTQGAEKKKTRGRAAIITVGVAGLIAAVAMGTVFLLKRQHANDPQATASAAHHAAASPPSPEEPVGSAVADSTAKAPEPPSTTSAASPTPSATAPTNPKTRPPPGKKPTGNVTLPPTPPTPPTAEKKNPLLL